jgi:hypothetical protein
MKNIYAAQSKSALVARLKKQLEQLIIQYGDRAALEIFSKQ